MVENVKILNSASAILSMAADNTKNRLKAGLPRHVVPPSGGNASNNPTRLGSVGAPPAEAGTTYLANARGPAFRRSEAIMRTPRTLCAHCALERWGETLSEL